MTRGSWRRPVGRRRMQPMTDRVAGILLHPTSLPGPWGAGDFGPSAEVFLDWAARAGFGLWQVLPLHPSAAGNSPYSCLSAFALDPSLIALERLVTDGLLDEGDLPSTGDNTDACDFAAVRALKAPLLEEAWRRHRENPQTSLVAEIQAFDESPSRRLWLEDWSLFAALKGHHGGAPWWSWKASLRDRRDEELEAARTALAEDIGRHRFLQFLAFKHWRALRQAARDRGIEILGDVPIYVAHDSAEVWSQPHLFELDAVGRPLAVAGVPPDYFAEDGQLWGNPLFRWSVMAEDGYNWWVERLRANLELADWVRLDHFRAFADYWRIPGGAQSARDGEWVDGPGKALFDAFAAELGTPLPLIAEDLGDLSEAARGLRREVELPCMRVLHFAFEDAQSEHATFRLPPETLLYTGTHDNDTTVGWFDGLDDAVKEKVLAFVGAESASRIHRHLIRLAMTSVARWAVVPMQDVLGLGSAARMNTPGVAEGNWRWRLQSLPSLEDADWLRRLVEVSGRLAQPE